MASSYGSDQDVKYESYELVLIIEEKLPQVKIHHLSDAYSCYT